MNPLRDLTGQTFGKLTVVSRAPNRGKSTCWNCRCECGGEIVAVGHHLKSSGTRSCGCIRRENSRRLGITNPPRSFRYDDPTVAAFNHVFGTYVSNARIRSREWALSYDQALKIFASPCYYCGIGPSNVTRKPGIFYNGIDRVDSNLGYVISNVVPACGTCNKAKLDMTQNEFLGWVDRIASFRSGATRFQEVG